MAEKSRLIWQIFQAIENNDDEHYLWNLLEQITTTSFDQGIVYMTYAGETPQSSAEKLNRSRLLQLLQLHEKLTHIRAQFQSYGSSGIDLGLARYFVKASAIVIITGRREQSLKEATNELNELQKKKVIYRINYVANVNERRALYDWIIQEHPQTNILNNNDGIQKGSPIPDQGKPAKNFILEEQGKVIEINLSAPIHLSYLFVSHFRQMNVSKAIVKVSSGLAFVTLASTPIYSATKAALHSFTMSLRYQMMNNIKNVHVYEIVPPTVQTNLGGGQSFGEPLDEYCRATFESLLQDQQEIGYRISENMSKMTSREEVNDLFVKLNGNLKKAIQDSTDS
ncbi:hypothetical protein I4U23_002967 [Adineta vaga]|nr:hypothetical protein I4U23_002967 [Adineta vaga]